MFVYMICKRLFAGTLPANENEFAWTVPANKTEFELKKILKGKKFDYKLASIPGSVWDCTTVQ